MNNGVEWRFGGFVARVDSESSEGKVIKTEVF
jgi:hypothetical protein